MTASQRRGLPRSGNFLFILKCLFYLAHVSLSEELAESSKSLLVVSGRKKGTETSMQRPRDRHRPDPGRGGRGYSPGATWGPAPQASPAA